VRRGELAVMNPYQASDSDRLLKGQMYASFVNFRFRLFCPPSLDSGHRSHAIRLDCPTRGVRRF
jgi:hypothetical protein